MSTILVTDLIPGEEATSADVNLTLDSFNDGTAAGELGSINFRVEALDRRSFPQTGSGVVEQASLYFYAEDSASAAVNSAAYAVVPLDAGANPAVMPGAITAPASAMLVLHASVAVSKNTIPATVNLPMVWCRLEQSTDGGGTWAKLTGSERFWRMRDTSPLCDPAGVNGVPGIKQTFSWAQYVATTNVATLYRITYRTSNGSFTFDNGIITAEVILT